jgi:predicted RNase H-like nuclease (RuvC/YqgF family)
MITLEKFKEIQTDQNYKHIGLFNRDGAALVRFNSTNKTPSDRLEMIEKRLNSPTLTDEYYIIKGKNNTQGDTITDDYIIINENVQPMLKEEINGGTYIPPIVGDKVYNFKEGIELNSKLVRLEIENAHLQTKIKELEDLVKDLEDQLAEVETLEETKENPIQDFLTETLKTAAPLLDKYFELKERKIQLAENQQYNPQAAQDPSFNNLNKDGADILDEKIKMFILSQDPETQEFLKQTYNASGTLDGFFTMVDERDPTILQDLKSYVNGN